MSNNKKKIAYISVTNDLTTDQRVHKVATFLSDKHIEVILIGRKFSQSMPVKRKYKTKRFGLLFNKKIWFYAEYNIRLFIYLLFKKFDFLVANDLDTLPANYCISKLKQKPLVYDSHEYFTEVPELISKKKVKRVWKAFERAILPKVLCSYTVSDSIAEEYNKKYNINMHVVRNLPLKSKKITVPEPPLQLPDNKIIIYQGSLNIHRGLETMINAMHFLNDWSFVIIGTGDIEDKLKDMVQQQKLNSKVWFLGAVPFDELPYYTQKADIGISLEEHAGLNYYYALPNKLFDYIHAKIPVLCSNMKEMAALVNHYTIGEITETLEPSSIAQKINSIKANHSIWEKNLDIAANELCWENETARLEIIYKSLI